MWDIPKTFMPLLNCRVFVTVNCGSLVMFATKPSTAVALTASSTITSTFLVTVWICGERTRDVEKMRPKPT